MSLRRVWFFALLVVMAAAPAALADEPLFGFAYTTDLLPKGTFELTQWSTTRLVKHPAGNFWLQENRTEEEFGLSDKLQLAFYQTYDWTAAFHNGPFGVTTPAEPFSYDQPGPDDRYRASRFIGVSSEVIYRLLSPYTHAIGLAVYEEPTFGPGFIESESKVIVQKNFRDDRLVMVGNFTYAPEWRWLPQDSDPSRTTLQEETDININVGATYRFVPNWSLGAELFNEREFNSYDFTHLSNSGYYLGPSLHFGGRHFYTTAGLYIQMPWASTHEDTVPGGVFDGRIIDNDFEKYRVRIKAGWYF